MAPMLHFVSLSCCDAAKAPALRKVLQTIRSISCLSTMCFGLLAILENQDHVTRIRMERAYARQSRPNSQGRCIIFTSIA